MNELTYAQADALAHAICGLILVVFVLAHWLDERAEQKRIRKAVDRMHRWKF